MIALEQIIQRPAAFVAGSNRMIVSSGLKTDFIVSAPAKRY